MMAVTVTMGFVLAHNLALGHDLSQLRSVSVTILTLYRMLLGEDAYDEVKNLEYSAQVLVSYLVSWSHELQRILDSEKGCHECFFRYLLSYFEI